MMPDIKTLHCTSCGHPYIEGGFEFCQKCGASLSRKTIDMKNYIERLDDEPRPYQALRFTSALISVLGWVVILLGWFLALALRILYGDIVPRFLFDNQTPNFIVQNIGSLIAAGFAFVNTIAGVVLVAAGQVFAVWLDLRDDMNITMRIIRRFVLSISENK